MLLIDLRNFAVSNVGNVGEFALDESGEWLAWTIETKDRNFADIELFGHYRGRLPKKICIGAVSHRTLQADRAEEVAGSIRTALKYIEPGQLIVSSDCGFGRQGCNREIAFYKAVAEFPPGKALTVSLTGRLVS